MLSVERSDAAAAGSQEPEWEVEREKRKAGKRKRRKQYYRGNAEEWKSLKESAVATFAAVA